MLTYFIISNEKSHTDIYTRNLSGILLSKVEAGANKVVTDRELKSIWGPKSTRQKQW